MSFIYIVLEKVADYEDVPEEVEHLPDEHDVSVIFTADSLSPAQEVADKIDLRYGYVAEIHAKRHNVDDGFCACVYKRGWWQQEKKKPIKKRKLNKK